MKTAPFHLNLLSDAEKLSSSPFRLRVMLPVLAVLAVAGMIIWWGMLTTQMLIVRSRTSVLRENLAAKKSQHDAIVGGMKRANEESAQLRQLEMYRGGCVTRGETFAAVAEALPVKMQLLRMELPPPPPQKLRDPGNPKKSPLPGPTNDTESASLTMAGRATRETVIMSFMESLEGPAFAGRLDGAAVRSVQQEARPPREGEERLLAFEIECRAAGRKFAK